jgi:hypothetical protein
LVRVAVLEAQPCPQSGGTIVALLDRRGLGGRQKK